MHKVLYIDLENCTGGTSRSLYHLVKYLDRSQVEPHVFSPKSGPNVEMYRALGVPLHIEPDLPTLPSNRRNNWYSAAWFLLKFPRYIGPIRRILAYVREHGITLIHINHTNFFALAYVLKKLTSLPVVMHVRTRMYVNAWSRVYARIMQRATDFYIFITEMEKERLLDHFVCELPPHAVLYNISEYYEVDDSEVPVALPAGKFLVISLKNIRYVNGIDRIVEVAAALAPLNRDVVFVICGKVQHEHVRQKVVDETARLGLEDMILLAGFQDRPEKLLQKCHALINVHRRKCPWGRDVIESLTYGKPAVAVGEFDTFIRPGRTGYLFPEFDPQAMAQAISGLASDPERYAAMSASCTSLARELFDGPGQSAKLLAVYDKVSSNGAD
jgi:glycosyltransferase involved in cell wall biosynthesis